MTLVLIVEDNPINRDVLGRRLERRVASQPSISPSPISIRITSGISVLAAAMPLGPSSAKRME